MVGAIGLEACIPKSEASTNLYYFSSTADAVPNTFTIQAAGVNSPKDAIFSLKAPRLLWKQRQDWVNANPSNIVIKLNPKNRDKRRTPIVHRLERLQKKVYRKSYGIKEESARQKYLEEVDSVYILAGEPLNEAVNELSLSPSVSPYVSLSSTIHM